jgi:hypothetical protein
MQYSNFTTVLILLGQRRTALFDKGFAALLGLAATLLDEHTGLIQEYGH